jgi:hypothetical protein
LTAQEKQDGLKIHWQRCRVGSSPITGTSDAFQSVSTKL